MEKTCASEEPRPAGSRASGQQQLLNICMKTKQKQTTRLRANLPMGSMWPRTVHHRESRKQPKPPPNDGMNTARHTQWRVTGPCADETL